MKRSSLFFLQCFKNTFTAYKKMFEIYLAETPYCVAFSIESPLTVVRAVDLMSNLCIYS